ncbi:hypothetical protein PRIC2_012731 [Phytophthora ramorum]
MQRDNASGTGYEPRSVQLATANSSLRPDLRWGRLSFAQFRDEEFLAKQLRRIEITQGARRAGRSAHAEAVTLTGLAPDKTIRQRLVAAQTKAARGASEDEELDSKAETLATEVTVKTDDEHERELTNALCVLGDLQQPELATLMATTLKDALGRGCTFPNPVYQLIALRRQLVKSMHEAVAAQHRQRKTAVQVNVAIAKCLETSQVSVEAAQSVPDVVGALTTIKPKEKVAREASMGIHVLISFLSDLHDPAVSTLSQRREFLEDLLPLLRSMGFLSLCPRTNSSGAPLTARGVSSRSSTSCGPSPGTTDIAEFTEKIQRFLLDMCPRYTSIPSSSPKLPAISSGSSECDVLDRTNAVNGLIHLAAATGSVRDFLVVLRVLLGASDYSSDKELRSSLSSRSLLTSSVPLLAPVRAEELPSPTNSGRDDDAVTKVKLTAKEAGVTRPDSSKPQKGGPLSKRETEILGDGAVQDTLRRKALPKGMKAIGASTNGGSTTVNIAMSHSPHHRLLYSSPGNNLMRTKDELKDALLLGNASLSLDMSKMKESLSRDTPASAMLTTRSETPVVTARCPKFKALSIQSVLVELNQAKPAAVTRASRGKPSSSLPTANAGGFSNDASAFAGDDDEGDREAWSCGQNSYGELGHGDTASRKSFERIESLQQKEIVQIGAGNEHTIALTADGKVLTCGYNDNGQCGQGGTARVSHLSEVPKLGENSISQVHAYNGCEHTILVTMEGRAATCGYNYRGQLGHGNTASESVPKVVRSLENRIVRLVSCSYYHTVMACEEDGSGQQFLYTFGRNDYGQLGHNDSIDRKVPQHVEALNDQHIVSVACGQYHTMVVTATGKAFAFGKNDYGQLGVDSMENQLVPVQVRAGLEKQECLEIRCGYYHTIALCSGAHLFGFGRNDYGQLGLGRSGASLAANLQLQQQRFSYARLIEELEGKDIVRFACGCYHTVAVSDNGVMYVFGRNNHGQLGTGDTNERLYPFPIDDFVGKRVALVAAGFYHTVVLTGGKDDEKNDQDAAGNDKGEASTAPVSTGITHSAILSASAVQELLDPNKRLELENSSRVIKSETSKDDTDPGAETPAVDPTDDDFRDEDRNPSSKSGGGSSRTDPGDALFVATVILAQLERLCQPFIPKPGSYPTLHHPPVGVVESLVANTATSSFDVSGAFEGSFESFGIHNCSSTFESLAVLLKHLSTKKIETSSQLMSCLVPQCAASSAAATPRRQSQQNLASQLQLYMLLGCIRVLQANLSQLLRSGMAKAVILLSTGMKARKPPVKDAKAWATELDRMRAAMLQVREVLMSLIDIKYRRNVCYVLDNVPSEGENATRIAEAATATLMQGFEVFFPCQCLQRQFCMHTMHEMSTSESIDRPCGALCRRDLWSIDALPRSKTLLLEPLLRRIAEDSLIVRFLPLALTSPPASSPPWSSGQVAQQENQGECVSSVTELYQLLLERIAADFARRLGEVVAARPSSAGKPRQDATLRAFIDALAGLQKHLSSWAASVTEWTMKGDSELSSPSTGIETQLARVVDRVFRVDEHDLDKVPVAWRSYIEFAMAAMGQCCEVLGQVFSMESIPSPTHGYDRGNEFSVGLQGQSLRAKMLELVEHSLVGRFLPLLTVSLFEFSNNALFAAALLPTLKTLLRLLDGFNRRDAGVEDAEKLFVDSVASSVGPRPPQKENGGSFRRKSDGNLLSLGSARDADGKTTGRKGLTTSEAMALPWHYRLEKELAVLAAEMAVTLVIGDPFFTYGQDDALGSGKLSERWLSSPLFRGGLSSKHLTQSIQHGRNQRGADSSKHARVVQHSPFPAVASALCVALSSGSQPFSLMLPPPPASEDDTDQRWDLPTQETYGEMFCPDSVRRFLASLQRAPDPLVGGAATKLCEWVRDSYAKKDPSYRMIVRQSQLSMNLNTPANTIDRQVHENDILIETCCFAALLHHNTLGSQAYHFALGIERSPPEARGPPPRSFLTLWQCVSQLRRRVAAKKTEIKSTPTEAAESPRMSAQDRIVAFQQTILDRCKLLLLVDVHEEQEHLSLQLDAGYIAPYDPAFLVSASSAFKLSAPSAKRHLHATYTDDKLPFLTAFPLSKWRKVRMILHSVIRWKSLNNRQDVSSRVSQEVLAYVTTDEAVSSTSAIKALLVDPCRRVSCSIRGLETLWELLTVVSFDSIQADIVYQVTQVFVFQPSGHSLLTGSQNVGYFYSSLQSETFSEFLGRLTAMMTDKAVLLMEPGEADTTATFWIVIVLLSAWGIHFKADQFEFVSDIGILNVIQEMLQTLSSKRGGDIVSEASVPVPSVDSIVGRSGGQSTLAQRTVQSQLGRLEDTLWVLFRYICVHFAVQNVREASGGLSTHEVYVPTFPVLSGVANLLFTEAVAISNRFLPLPASVNGIDMAKEESLPVVPVAVRRSFELITEPQRFSSQSKGVTSSYEEMVSPSGPESITPMSPLLKPNEFSVTTWLYINNSQASPSQTTDSDLFHLGQDPQDRQLVFMRGAAREVSLYLVLVPESIDNWQLEVGILMDLNREADGGVREFAVKGRIWERVLSKQAVAGGKWIHVAVVLEATKIRLYLNGVLDCQRSLAAQSVPIWTSGNVDLPIHFGRFPTPLESTQTHPSSPAVASAIGFLSRSLGLMKSASWDAGMTLSSNTLPVTELKTAAFKSFDGWLSHFRFHNRSLSPIHVRIVFDEKKSPSDLSPGGAVNACTKVVELHTLLLLLSSSSEGLVHFTSQFSQWMRLIWGTVLGSNSVVVQQSALRVLRALVGLQHPLEASKVLVLDCTDVVTLGFYKLEDVFVQQVIRLIGFCLSKCPTNGLSGDCSQVTVVPWSLMVPHGIHANDFSSEARDNTDQPSDLLNDVEIRYQSSKRQCLMVANELIHLLQRLFRCDDAWKKSIASVTSGIMQHFPSANEKEEPEQIEPRAFQFGKHTLSSSAIKSVESTGCVYFLCGGVEFLRPGVTVEMRGSRDFAQVLSLEYASPQNPAETPSGTKLLPTSNTLAHVRIDSSVSTPESGDSGSVPGNRRGLTWYDKVFGHANNCPTYSKINVDELIPSEAGNPNWNDGSYSSIIFDLASEQRHQQVFSVLVEKASEVIPVVYSQQHIATSAESELVSSKVGCMLLKVLAQIAGSDAGADELLEKPALIDAVAQLATSEDNNPTHETLFQVEKRVSALHREVYAALVELGGEGDYELGRAYDSRCEKQPSSPSSSGLNGDDLVLRDTTSGSRRRDESDTTERKEFSLPDADEGGQGNESWDPALGDEEESKLPAQDDDDDEDGDDEDDDDEDEDDEGSLDDADNDDEDDDDAEETRAEFVEELMLMGFPEDWCVLALKQTENDIVSASAWIVDNLEYLSKLQSTLDKERDKGRDSPRFDEEEDDVVPCDDTANASTQPPPLNSSNSWLQATVWSENDSELAKDDTHTSSDSPTKAVVSSFNVQEGDNVTAPPLNDKEMGRKLFGEMYFPFEDGGYLSNTKTRFMRSWRAEAIEMKARTAPSSPQPIADNTPETSRSPFEEDFQAELNQLDLRGLLEQLRTFERTLSILYARQCVMTLLHQTTGSIARLTISYAQWFKLLKLVLLRGDQFTVISRSNKTPQLKEVSVDEVLSKAFECFVDQDAGRFVPDALELCLSELEAAASSKRYEAVLWTQRDLKRPDKTVTEEPGIETVIWILDALLAGATRSTLLSLSAGFTTTILRRLRGCLGTTNLPLKFVVLRTVSRLLSTLASEGSVGQASEIVNEAQLVVGEFLTAAILRHSRELVQGRLLFSQYLQGYVELLHVLQRCTGFSDLAVARCLTQDAGGSGDYFSQPPPTAPIHPKLEGCSLHFDRKRSRSSLLAFAEDGLSVSYSGNEVWKAACAGVGFSTGVHSWVVRIEKSSSPYLFVGVATRQANLDSFLGADDQSWGFIGDKALYYQRNRVRAYGETFTEGDCIGLRLDCEKGELSFSKNGVDLGLAFDNIAGEVCPAVAFYSRHQKISFAKDSCVSSHMSSTGEDASASVEDCLVACEIMANWVANKPMRPAMCAAVSKMTTEWLAGSTKFVATRSGKSLWVDVTRETCGKLGFHATDRVRTPRGNGLVVGAAAGRMWVEVDNEPGAWFFHPSKVRLVTMASSTTSTLPTPPAESVVSPLPPRVDSSSVTSDSTIQAEVSSFVLSQEELVEYGEHVLWSLTVDRDLLSVINDFCEVSQTSPWNLTPAQLVNLVKEKTPALELTSVASVLALPQEKRDKMVTARFALLRYSNMYVSRALPFFDLTWHYFLRTSTSLPCRLISQCRGSLFVCVKNAIFTALMERTANSPKRADDEYDYPEDLPQLQVNRLKAAAAKCHEGTISSLFLSLFGQAFEELHFLPVRTQRMVYSHPMDDGQLRSFKVKFEGEGVDDYGGPYREFFSQFFAELQMLHVPEGGTHSENNADSSVNGGPSSTSLKLEAGVAVSECVLPFLMPSPNWRNGVGASREKFVLNGALITRHAGDAGKPAARVRSSAGESAEEKRQLYCEMFYFLGQMIGTCLRTRVCVRLDLAMSVWKQLVGEDDSNPENALETLKEIDFVAYSLWKTLRGILDDLNRLQATASTKRRELEEQLEAMDLVFTTVLSDGRTVELCEDGTNTAVTLANLEKYLDAMLRARVQETHEVMNIVKQGLHSIMPISALALLTWTELEKRMCGVAEVDVKLLQANTEYDEELSATDDFIQRFWRVLEGLESEDKRAFLRFVWARSRLPLGSAQFHQKFKIQALASSGTGDSSSSSGATPTSGGWMDSQMPKSHTCFFALQLPRYSSDEICREKLLYAVRNCVEMDGDFRLADTEMTGWTGISPTDQLRI